MRGRLAGVTLAAAAAVALAVPAGAAAERLNSYKVKVAKASATLETLAQQGFDVTEGGKGRSIEIVATATQARKLRAEGVRARLTRAKGGRTALRAHMAAEPGWQVWRPYSRTDVALSGDAGNPKDNLVTQLQKLEQKYPKLADLQQIGTTHQGKPIYAMRVTKNPKQHKDGSRPAVLYTSVQHAREWLAGETNRRQLRLFLDNYGREGTAIGTDGQPVEGVSADELTKLVNTRELWFVLVVNPDGFDYTFTPENRLWRKNLRDNNGNGVIGDAGDGVDPNRNLNTNWGYDNEGSSDDPSSETYRGPSAGSEPETQAINGLSDRVDFAFNKNDHTWGRLLLYPFGWQVDTHAADEPIFRRIAGVEGDPAIPTFHPKVGADLYTTNGDMNDHLYGTYKTISMTPEGTPGSGTGSGFIFQDVEADVQAEFERHVQFALDMARSAGDRTRPTSWQDNPLPGLEANRFPVSFGSPQTIEVNARRDLGAVVAKYKINGGATRTLATEEWDGGERYGDRGDYWYHRLRAQITDAGAGDEVTVWFEAKKRNVKTEPFTYDQRSDSGDRVLILANEDYTGNSAFPAYPSQDGPFYASYYADALAANGIGSDVYDVDAEGRKAPHPLGVLSHYDAVVWETGNDNITRPAATPGVADPNAHYTQMAVRDFVNEGGKLLYAGVNAGRQYGGVAEYPGFGNPASDCDGTVNQNFEEPCKPLSNDFLQYYLGSYVRSDGGGLADDGSAYPLLGLADPFGGWSATLNGPDSAQNQGGSGVGIETGTHLVTSSILNPDQFPQFTSWEVADWQIPGDKPFDPHSGDWYMYSQDANQGYKRFTRTIDLTGETSGNLSFFTSYNTEADWDYVFVEAHTVGQDDWTTLPDANGHTGQDTGDSCPATSDWFALHPHMEHYQTRTGFPGDATTCTAGGTTGTWHAASGNSNGWQEWDIDLSAYAGKQVEVSISYVTDWATLPSPGMLLDDVTVTRGDEAPEATSFEDGLGGWAVGGPPEGSNNSNDWIRSQKIFEDAAIVATEDSLYFGFGLEGVTGAQAREDTMARAMAHLLP